MNKCSKCENESVIIQNWLCLKCLKIALFGDETIVPTRNATKIPEIIIVLFLFPMPKNLTE